VIRNCSVTATPLLSTAVTETSFTSRPSGSSRSKRTLREDSGEPSTEGGAITASTRPPTRSSMVAMPRSSVATPTTATVGPSVTVARSRGSRKVRTGDWLGEIFSSSASPIIRSARAQALQRADVGLVQLEDRIQLDPGLGELPLAQQALAVGQERVDLLAQVLLLAQALDRLADLLQQLAGLHVGGVGRGVGQRPHGLLVLAGLEQRLAFLEGGLAAGPRGGDQDPLLGVLLAGQGDRVARIEVEDLVEADDGLGGVVLLQEPRPLGQRLLQPPGRSSASRMVRSSARILSRSSMIACCVWGSSASAAVWAWARRLSASSNFFALWSSPASLSSRCTSSRTIRARSAFSACTRADSDSPRRRRSSRYSASLLRIAPCFSSMLNIRMALLKSPVRW
jgi:hypothetical protein